MKKLWILLTAILIVSTSGTSCDDEGLPSIWNLTTTHYNYFNVKTFWPDMSVSSTAFRNTDLRFEFSQSIDSNTFNVNQLTIRSGSGKVSSSKYTPIWEKNGKVLILRAIGSPLAASEIYNIQLSNSKIRSKNGNPMKGDYSTAFTTSQISDHVSPTTTDHCVKSAGKCVIPDGTVYPVDGLRFTFSEPMNPYSVENAFLFTINGIEYNYTSVAWSADYTSVTFNFGQIPSGEAVMYMANTAMDNAGNPLDMAITKTFFVGGDNYVDYESKSVIQPLNASPNGKISGVSFKIQNVGRINGRNNVTWKAYLSSDTALDPGTDILIDSNNIPPLNGGTTITNAISVGSNSYWPSVKARYYLIISLSATDDGNIFNNTYVSPNTIGVGVPDYVISSSSFPSQGVPGSGFTGSFQLKNVGSGAGTSAVNWQVYLSIDETCCNHDVLMSSGTTAALINDSTSPTINYTGTWPATAAGYYLYISFDTPDDPTASQAVKGSGTISVTGGNVSSPIFTPGGGVYTAPQDVSISAPVPTGSTIIYTIDGSNPTANSSCAATNGTSFLSGTGLPITVSSSGIIKAIACNVGSATSAIQTGNYIIDTVAPTAGGGGTISSSGVTPTDVTLNWTAALDDNVSSLKYFVYQSSSPNIDSVANAETNGILLNGGGTSNISSYDVTNLTAGATYYYTIIVVDAAGNKTSYTMLTHSSVADTTVPTPGNTGTITTSAVVSTGLTLNWTASTDNVTVPANLRYFVYQSASAMNDIPTAEGSTLLNAGGTLDIATLDVTGLSPSTNYHFNIVVVDEANQKALYTNVSQTTLGDTTAPTPGATGSITTSTVTPTSLTLNWTAATDNVSLPANLRYFVYQSASAMNDIPT
ncbi:MAG: chitobiase/beta-hexosaminidase C-terminal domain-containing protein, partial [Spirochaetota bacterium]|nr:chitobiase/beta-hexosaminidase C-terminal domain-containing protein [Spirochaetota bacterium]